MFVTAVCILFLLKFKWPKNKSLNVSVYERYGHAKLNQYILLAVLFSYGGRIFPLKVSLLDSSLESSVSENEAEDGEEEAAERQSEKNIKSKN